MNTSEDILRIMNGDDTVSDAFVALRTTIERKGSCCELTRSSYDKGGGNVHSTLRDLDTTFFEVDKLSFRLIHPTSSNVFDHHYLSSPFGASPQSFLQVDLHVAE